MSTEESSIAPLKLSFGTTFGAAFGAVFGQFWMFVKAAILPFVLSLVLGGLGFLVVLSVPALSLPFQILGLIPFALLGIAFCRLVLIGRQAGAIPRPLFGRRTWIYFGYTLLFAVFFVLPVMIFSIVFIGTAVFTWGTDPQAQPDFQAIAQVGLMVPLLFVFYLVFLYFITRLSLVFPAVAVDQKLGLGGSWRLTRGSGFKLYLVLVVITILSVIAMAIVLMAVNGVVFALLGGFEGFAADPNQIDWMTIAVTAAPVGIVGIVLEYLAAALVIAAIAEAYGQLSGWGGPREEVLERFE